MNNLLAETTNKLSRLLFVERDAAIRNALDLWLDRNCTLPEITERLSKRIDKGYETYFLDCKINTQSTPCNED